MNTSEMGRLWIGCCAIACILACGEQWHVDGESEAVAIELAATDVVEVEVEVSLTSSVDELECGRLEWSVSSALGEGLMALDAPDFEVLDGVTTLASDLDLAEAGDDCRGSVTIELEAQEAISAPLTFLARVSHKRGGQTGPDAQVQVTANVVD